MPRSYGITNVAPYSSAPAVGSAGDTYFNTTNGRLYISNGTAWLGVMPDSEVEAAGWIPASYTWLPVRNNVLSIADLSAGWGGFPTGTRINATISGSPFYGVVVGAAPGAAGIAANPMNPVSWNLVANGTFTRSSNGLVNNDVVWISGGNLPTPLSLGVPYYVINVNVGANTFQLSGTQGGAVINLSGTPSTVEIRTGTLLTLAPNADYGLTRGTTITLPRYSYSISPPGYPGWFNYTTAQVFNPLTFTLGYSVIPTSLAYNYRIDGNTCIYNMRDGVNGTSNATTLSISLPVTAASTPSGILWNGSIAIVDNGATVSTAAGCQVAPGATVVQCWRDYGNVGAWTATLGKRIIRGQIIYGV